jgi:hypothetical protein
MRFYKKPRDFGEVLRLRVVVEVLLLIRMTLIRVRAMMKERGGEVIEEMVIFDGIGPLISALHDLLRQTLMLRLRIVDSRPNLSMIVFRSGMEIPTLS